jgi:hypothetical protein
MDALDEFFSTWCAPEAWCERCGEYPALHVLYRVSGAKYAGVPTCVRVWDAAQHAFLAVCRQCCKPQVEVAGEATPQLVLMARHQPGTSWRQTLRRFLRYCRYWMRLHVAKR